MLENVLRHLARSLASLDGTVLRLRGLYLARSFWPDLLVSPSLKLAPVIGGDDPCWPSPGAGGS